MAQPTAVILVVGLNRSLIGDWSPHIKAFADAGIVRTLNPAFPAVTCSVQSSMLTGLQPREHGIVGNGWYNREQAEVQFWKQSNHLVRGEKVWETARKRDPNITCANLFWWYNMYSSAEFSVTPRPIYKADGRKLPDVYTEPPDLRGILQSELGQFPLFKFWGPAASIESSRWIADAAMFTHQHYSPALTLVYLPHLDYPLQKLGPQHASIRDEVRAVDGLVGELIDYFRRHGVRPMLVSEYGIETVEDSIHINRMLRQEDALRVREEQGLELLDAGASAAFAVADHQIAHVYVDQPQSLEYFEDMCKSVPGVDRVLNRTAQAKFGIDHERSGELVLIAEPRKWFSYDYWLDDAKAPDFARTVDIHRKPGYDPLELFLDPDISMPKLKIARKLLAKKMGFRTLLNVIPLDTKLVRGSHGRVDQAPTLKPVLITDTESDRQPEAISCCAMRDVILEHLGCID
jgi:predicted AlkP superfamily pyrophosphatase or phosphodiesterase